MRPELWFLSLELTRDLLSNEDVLEDTLKLCAKALNETYAQLSHDVFHFKTFSSKAREFALFYVALADHAQAQEKCLFHITGKFHLFMEMASFMNSRNPSDVWTYRDEAFGGEISSLAARRGDPAILMQLAWLFPKGLWQTTMPLACKTSVLLLLLLGWWFFRSSYFRSSLSFHIFLEKQKGLN